MLAWRRHDRLRGGETALQEEFEQEHAVPDPMLLCAGRRRPTPYAAKRLLQRRNCSEGPPLLPGWDATAPRAAAAVALVDPLVQNVVASIIILSVAFLWARWLNRFLREILA